MPSIPISTSPSSHQKPLHLLRALLREASYLPDANARSYFHHHILHRFRAYQPSDASQHRAFRRRKGASLDLQAQRTRTVFKKARQGLSLLRRANHGEPPALQRILYLTYGRTGKRKYALIHDLLRPDPVLEAEKGQNPGPAPLQQLYYSNKRWLQYFDAPIAALDSNTNEISISNTYSRLRLVLKSQRRHGLKITSGFIKGHIMKTPRHNVWMRPMPIKRARNNVRRWYAEAMTRLLPPIPSEEWDDIQAIISGEKPVSLVKRRAPASVYVNSEPGSSEEDLFEHRIKEALALDKPNLADRPVGMQRPHTITPKFMRRFYSRLLAICCKLELDESNKWQIYWGPQPIPKLFQASSVAVEHSLFAGVTSKGQLKSDSSRISASDPKLEFEMEIDQSDDELNAGRQQKSKTSRSQKRDHPAIPFYAHHLPKSHPHRKILDDLEMRRKQEAATGVVPGR